MSSQDEQDSNLASVGGTENAGVEKAGVSRYGKPNQKK